MTAKKRRRSPRWLKALGNNAGVRQFACFILATYVRLVYRAGRWQTVGSDQARAQWEKGEPFILAFWHGRLLMMPYCWRTQMPMKMLISNHRDGALIADTIAHFGLGTIRGSAKKKGSDREKGGAGALRAMVKAIKAGNCVGITPDGPHGPYMRASEGAVVLAKLSGAPILPATFSASAGRTMKSWDRFLIAFPFSRGIIMWGDPIAVPRDADRKQLETATRDLELEINTLSHRADELMGRRVTRPETLIERPEA